MASAARGPEGLECPVCMELMTVPIYNCMSGHSLCNTCTVRLPTPYCPICRQEMTQIRNRHLEDLVAKVETHCKNRAAGCVYKVKPAQLDDHLKECIFREMDCPLGVIFGKCSWNGELKNMMDHFKERHPESYKAPSDADVALNDVSVAVDDRRVFFTNMARSHFIITFKIDTLQKMSFWCVQLIGAKGTARQWLYEIHVVSQSDARRKIVFTDYCSNDGTKADEVFKSNKCALLPLDALASYVKDKKMAFRFFIKRAGPAANKENKPDNQNGGGNPPGPHGPPGGQGKPHMKKDKFQGPHPGKPGGSGPGGSGPGGPGPNKKGNKNPNAAKSAAY